MSAKAHGVTSRNAVVFTSVVATCFAARNTFVVRTDLHVMLKRELTFVHDPSTTCLHCAFLHSPTAAHSILTTLQCAILSLWLQLAGSYTSASCNTNYFFSERCRYFGLRWHNKSGNQHRCDHLKYRKSWLVLKIVFIFINDARCKADY